ncbi:MAG: hypothetical protein JNK55_15120 [Rubrivivax sp.]|nr:hypothetical protein [Rubrivivax sp.]
MKSAFVSLALATSLIGGPAMAASASKAVLPQPAAGHAPHSWNTGMIDGSIKLRPTPPTGLAAAAAAPATVHMATAHPPVPSRGAAPAAAGTAATPAGHGALPYLAASMALLVFLALRLRRGA